MAVHTLEYMRQTSPALFTAVLAASAKFFRQDLYKSLLSYAQQLVARGMADTVVEIGFVQAMLVLVYWKEPTDSSGWLRIGYAVRLGQQLRLHMPPPREWPTEEGAARECMNRARTWIVLVCFDHSYRLHSDDGYTDSYRSRARMTHSSDFDFDGLLEASKAVQVPHDDAAICASVEYGYLMELFDEIQPSSSMSLVTSAEAIVARTESRYLHSSARWGPLQGAAADKLSFWHANAHVNIARARVICSGDRKDIAIAQLLCEVERLVVVIEGLVTRRQLSYLQDTAATAALSLAECMVKVSSLVAVLSMS